jgi:hypothetical protein
VTGFTVAGHRKALPLSPRSICIAVRRHLKTHYRFVRDLSGAQDEFHLVGIVQNLKRLATLM